MKKILKLLREKELYNFKTGRRKRRSMLIRQTLSIDSSWELTPAFLPGESPWTEEPGVLQSKRSQRVGHD